MNEATLPARVGTVGDDSADPRRRSTWDFVEVGLAVAAFVVLGVVILRTATYLPEPDDYAYRGSIVAMTDGHFLSLSTAQFNALAHQLGSGPLSRFGPGGQGPPAIAQWVHLDNGRWISEKDPGYPFLAAPFQALGIIRLAQLFYGALACIGLFAGARRWLGRFGGAAAVGLYCSSGAALLFGWRDYLPTFTDGSLIAAGTGALVWTLLAVEASARRRTIVGLAGFLALEAATFARYTDVLVLGCAIIAVVAARRRLPGQALWWWLGSAALFGAGVAVFDDLVYGGPLQTGYRPGEITFSLSAIGPNFRYMPAHLWQAMPEFVIGLAALAWLLVERVRLRRAAARRDLAVGVGLGASWFAMWGLYATYTWTAGPGASTLQTARFYVPALGAISLLGAWLVTKVPRRDSVPALAALATAAVVAVMFVLGIRAFNDMVASPFGSIRVAHACGPHHGGRGRPRGPVICVGGPVRSPVRRPGAS